MSENAEKALAIYQSQVGEEIGVSEWFEVDQDRINLFADATLDHQFIHIDPVKSAELSPYKVTIAHGFLTLSLLPYFMSKIPAKDPAVHNGVVMGVNYGLGKVRFPAPVPVNSKLRARQSLASVELVGGGNTLQVTYSVVIEVEGGAKPVCVAESIMRSIYG